MSERTPSEIGDALMDAQENVTLLFRRKPNLAMAAISVVVGSAAILCHFPTNESAASLGGALFGAAALFTGAWVAETTKAASEKQDATRRMEAARVYFTPELARVIAQHVYILNRLVANFVSTSMKYEPPGDPLTAFRPRKPLLYPSAPQFRDLSEADATLLIEFYDASHGIAETVNSWIEGKTALDFNAYNVLMQDVMNSLRLAEAAVESFCPDRQYSPIMPASGTLSERIKSSILQAEGAMKAHQDRAEAARIATERASSALAQKKR
ncbi:hypothetical protein [Paraburkholderia bryophila]|uniref:Uncharacterized protein n=1 Tax=Paraburkholderia bryophila TaxID=420952 RepID=A0A7Y9WRN3_9BURK|nr:hypothetical protein [Paraburkholderia bryophila]NYH24683.1 hypothetical protein [Paraburkholderia bryophila]